MPEEIKEKIYKFLKDQKGKEFSILKISKAVKHSYQTVLKWTLVLEANPENKIQIRDFGNIKLVSYIGE